MAMSSQVKNVMHRINDLDICMLYMYLHKLGSLPTQDAIARHHQVFSYMFSSKSL